MIKLRASAKMKCTIFHPTKSSDYIVENVERIKLVSEDAFASSHDYP